MKPSGPRDAGQYQQLAFRDYQAARCLLLNDLLIPGATLASTAVEKYLKCVLAMHGHKAGGIHLDKLEDFKRKFRTLGLKLVEELDSRFLDVLSCAFRLRYYDNLEMKAFGFLKWQLLCELDSSVDRIESDIAKKKNAEGKVVESDYRKAIRSADASICEQNYLVTRESKSEFMGRESPAVGLRVDSRYEQLMFTGGTFRAEYKGNICTLLSVELSSMKGLEGPRRAGVR